MKLFVYRNKETGKYFNWNSYYKYSTISIDGSKKWLDQKSGLPCIGPVFMYEDVELKDATRYSALKNDGPISLKYDGVSYDEEFKRIRKEKLNKIAKI